MTNSGSLFSDTATIGLLNAVKFTGRKFQRSQQSDEK